MANRTVTDVGGREWTCVPTLTAAAGTEEPARVSARSAETGRLLGSIAADAGRRLHGHR